MSELEKVIVSYIAICDKHALRLTEAREPVTPLFPMNEATADVDALPRAVRHELEVMISRFCKLQDTIGRKIFHLYLESHKEYTIDLTFIDVLNRLEKLYILPSVVFWDHLREVRNKLTHEYPNEPDLVVGTLNEVFTASGELLAYWQTLRGRVIPS